jgi:hypothetical protein
MIILNRSGTVLAIILGQKSRSAGPSALNVQKQRAFHTNVYLLQSFQIYHKAEFDIFSKCNLTILNQSNILLFVHIINVVIPAE